MSDFLLPLVLIILASAFLGTFGLGMKYMNPLPWEAWWLVHSTVGMVIFPMTWAWIAVPDLFTVIFNSPPAPLLTGAFYGFLWGIGGMLFGVSVRYVGVSITYGVVMGLAGAAGSMIPLVQMGGAADNPAAKYIIVGVTVMLVGVAICCLAGVKRDRLLSSSKTTDGSSASADPKIGVAIAVTSGVLSSLINVGFANATPVAVAAEKAGALTRNSSLAAWVVVLWGAILMNAGVAIYKLSSNRTWKSFLLPGTAKAYKWAVISALLWFGALGVYGQGAALMGSIGPAVGWPIFLGLSLIVSNALGYSTGEWKGAAKPFRLMIGGIVILIVACIIIGYANHVKEAKRTASAGESSLRYSASLPVPDENGRLMHCGPC